MKQNKTLSTDRGQCEVKGDT